jgi:multidrug efflux pump
MAQKVKAKDNTIVFSDYKVPKAVMTLALPSVFGMLINIIYNLADTFFVGQTGDANQVAAVSVSMPVFMIFLAIGNLFGVGGCAYISRSLGEGKKEKVKTISSFCAYASMIGGAIISVIFLIFRNPILRLIGASDNTIGYANDYMFWLAISSPLIVMGICASNLVRGEGAAKDSVIGTVIGQIANVILDPIFILNKGDRLFSIEMPFGLGRGAEGAAIATVIGNVLTLVYFIVYFMRGKSILSINPRRFSAKDGIAKGVISVGTPAALNSLLMSFSNIIINMFLAKYGDNAVAAMGVAMKANMLVVMFQIGVGQGIQPLVGYCFGAKDEKGYPLFDDVQHNHRRSGNAILYRFQATGYRNIYRGRAGYRIRRKNADRAYGAGRRYRYYVCYQLFFSRNGQGYPIAYSCRRQTGLDLSANVVHYEQHCRT